MVKVQSVVSPYSEMLGVESLGRGRPKIEGDPLPVIKGLDSVERKRCRDRALLVLRLKHAKEYRELFEQEARYYLSTVEGDANG